MNLNLVFISFSAEYIDVCDTDMRQPTIVVVYVYNKTNLHANDGHTLI